MTDHSSRHWPPRLSDLRVACEECHKRKVRCEPPQEEPQNSCEACRTNHRTCLFSLRSRTGRPRKSKPNRSYPIARTISSRPLESPAEPGSSPQTITGPLPYEFRSESRTDEHVSGRPQLSSSLAGQYPDHFPFCGPGLELAGSEASLRHLPWPPSIETKQDGLDLLLGNPTSGELPIDSALSHLGGDDFVLEMPQSPLTFQTALTTSAHNHTDQHKLQQRLEQPRHAAFWETPSTEEPSDGGASRASSRRTDSERSGGAEGTGGGTVTAAMSGDFFDTMRLCGEMNNRYQSKVLDVLASADERELAVVLGNIEELGQKTVTALRDAEGTSGLSSRQEQYNWMLVRVVVLGAIDSAADLVEHNLFVHNGKAPEGRETDAPEDGFDLAMMDTVPTTPYGVQRDHDEAASSGVPPTDSLAFRSVLALVRLDYALSQFALFLSAGQWDMERCPEPPKRTSRRKRHGRPPDESTSTTLARLDQIRAQVWALVEGIRRLW